MPRDYTEFVTDDECVTVVVDETHEAVLIDAILDVVGLAV